MRDLGKTVAFMPARAGSKRVKAKNLRNLSGQPLLSYSINTAKKCFPARDIYVNSDSKDMLGLAHELGVNGYHRNEALASDNATGDQFTIDFIQNIKMDTLVMISPVCPLITSEDVFSSISAYQSSNCDTLITCERTKMQVFCQDQPVNINLGGQLSPTQDNPSVDILNWAVTIWDVKSFIDNFKETGSAYIGKNRLLHPIDPLHGLKISYEADFHMAECLISGKVNTLN
jgi:CMP-N-acetylneuraminic acid synthetase